MRWQPARDPDRYIRHLRAQKLEPKPPIKSLHGLKPDQMAGWVDDLEIAASMRLVQATRSLVEAQEWEGRRVTFQPEGRKPYRVKAEGPYTPLRRQPSNVPTVIASVHSYPAAADDSDPKYAEWKRRMVRAILKHYGHRHVVTIVEHVDEKFAHLHAIVTLPKAAPIAGRHSMKACRDAAEARGEPKEDLGEWYRQGGRSFQNFFWKHVGRHIGWAHPRNNPDAAGRMTPEHVAARKQLDDEIAAANAKDVARRAAADASIGKKATKVAGTLTAMEAAFKRVWADREDNVKKVEERAEAAEQKRKATQAAADQALKDAAALRLVASASESVAVDRMVSAAAAHRQVHQIVEDLKRGGHLKSGEYEELSETLKASKAALAKMSRTGSNLV